MTKFVTTTNPVPPTQPFRKKYFNHHSPTCGHHKCVVPKFNVKANITYLEKRYQRREPSVFTCPHPMVYLCNKDSV